MATDNANEDIGLVKNAFALTFHNARISTSSGIETEQNKLVGLTSTVMSLKLQKNGGLLTYFDIFDETENGINNSSVKQKPINNHTQASGRLNEGDLPLEYVY